MRFPLVHCCGDLERYWEQADIALFLGVVGARKGGEKGGTMALHLSKLKHSGKFALMHAFKRPSSHLLDMQPVRSQAVRGLLEHEGYRISAASKIQSRKNETSHMVMTHKEPLADAGMRQKQF